MHIGRSNPHYEYHLNDKTLDVTVVEKDLGIHVTPDWKSEVHVAKVAAKANSMVGRIRRSFEFMDVGMFKAIYPSMIRSHMEHAVQAWSPQLKKDINLLELVQRRATKLVGSLRDCTYEQRKTALGLTSLEVRRARGDLIEVFKIIHGFENIQRDQFFKMESEVHEHELRHNELKIYVPQAASSRRRRFFDIRVINSWNELPRNLVRRQPISAFKSGLDCHINLLRGGTLNEPSSLASLFH